MRSLFCGGARRAGRGVLLVLLLAPCLAWAVSGGAGAVVDGPGDDRRGYERPDFQTRSLALEARVGIPADLVARASQPVLGLPPLFVPEDNALTQERVALGRKLFFDRRLSLNGTQSCAMCHIPEQGFTNNELATAVGIEGRSVGRNAPTLYNVAYKQQLFHDAREQSLEQQGWQPLLDRTEMANPSIGWVLRKLESLPDYDGLFEAAFDGRGPDLGNVPKAFAAYQRTLLAGNSRFDRWHFGKDETALSEEEIRGFELFSGAGGCVSCHTIEDDYALFTDHEMHNTGVRFDPKRTEGRGSRVLIAPGVFINVREETIRMVGGPPPNDLGRHRVTRDPKDRWHFATPTLRNVALTAPYMHDGSLRTLEAVVEFYDGGGGPNPLQDDRIQPLGLDEQERADLVAFLRSLTGEFRDLVLDGFAAPIGDVGVERRVLLAPESGVSP